MENFIVSARKYRPATFSSVVGQNPITSTLKNAIKNNHLAQAFLFCGPRGVGKTTCARILAKTINCFSITENIEACNECESCKSFDEGHSLNIYELDAASNNSVDDIRSLIEQVRFAPQVGSHKVYIIDEVHMLSQAAFNAFLKTLEEPPKHAIFILATTERHKIIPTILSRCQVFDFNRIQIEDTANHLAFIADSESITAEPDALHIIAQKSDGALRDALSMFDQIVSFSGNNITYQHVIDNLNILDYDYYFKIVDSLLKKDISSSLLTYNEILNRGFDGHNFVNGLSEHFRNLLVCQDNATINLLEVGKNIKEKYQQQANQCTITMLLEWLNITTKTDIQYKSSKNQRLLVEVMLMQLCSIENMSTEKKKPIINLPIKKGNSTEQNNKENTHQSAPPVKNSEEKKITETVTIAAPETVKEKPTPIKEEIENNKEENLATQKPNTTETNTETPEKKKVISPFLLNKNTPSFSESISISSTPKKEIESNTENNIKRPSVSFTPESFKTAWNNYKKILQEKGKASLASVFEEIPTILNNTEIELTLENKALEDDFNDQKIDTLDFLRKELNNYNIQITTKVNKDIKAKVAYTPQEKFQKMSEKNPSLEKLKQKLDLEIGYA